MGDFVLDLNNNNDFKVGDGSLAKTLAKPSSTSAAAKYGFTKNIDGTYLDVATGNTIDANQVGNLINTRKQAGLDPNLANKDMTAYQKGALGLQAVGAVIDWKQLGLAQDAFDFNKKAAEADYAANATQVNNMVNSSNNINRNVTNKVNAMQTANGGSANAVYNDKQTVAKTL